ncbi:SOS response-associated peptidase [Salinicola sp. CPA57]|uniref:SOS response-associated peptidase n=1 Tax=Salinicola sp. CPA57 TaxID=1949080 RepID=UPI000DA1F7C5|nr:SOS response-associated peptidase [Salinicola sp. CPA57]
MAGRLHVDDWTRHPQRPAFRGIDPPVLGPNLAPRRWLSMLRREANVTVLRDAFWGLTPTWLKVLDQAPHCARAESLDERPMFREAMAQRRCLIPVTGIYVWQPGLRGKQPFMVTHTDRSPLLLAGIWSRYAPDTGESRDSFALITVPTTEVISPMSDRLPAVIALSQAEEWLSQETSLASARNLIGVADRELLGAFPVSRQVNDPANQAWACGYPTGPMRVWSA